MNKDRPTVYKVLEKDGKSPWAYDWWDLPKENGSGGWTAGAWKRARKGVEIDDALVDAGLIEPGLYVTLNPLYWLSLCHRKSMCRIFVVELSKRDEESWFANGSDDESPVSRVRLLRPLSDDELLELQREKELVSQKLDAEADESRRKDKEWWQRLCALKRSGEIVNADDLFVHGVALLAEEVPEGKEFWLDVEDIQEVTHHCTYPEFDKSFAVNKVRFGRVKRRLKKLGVVVTGEDFYEDDVRILPLLKAA